MRGRDVSQDTERRLEATEEYTDNNNQQCRSEPRSEGHHSILSLGLGLLNLDWSMPSKAHTIDCDSGSPGSVASESEIAAISPGVVAEIGQLEYSWDPNETGLDKNGG